MAGCYLSDWLTRQSIPPLPQSKGDRLRIAASNNDITEVMNCLLSCCPNDADSTLGATPLLLAAEAGHANIVAALLADGRTDPNRCGLVPRSTALHMAVKNGHVSIARLLLADARTDANVKECLPGDTDSDYDTGPCNRRAENSPCSQNSSRFCMDLRAEGMKTERGSGPTALSLAVEAADEELVEMLLSHPDIDPNMPVGATRKELATPLIMCIERSCCNDIEGLLRNGEGRTTGSMGTIINDSGTSDASSLAMATTKVATKRGRRDQGDVFIRIAAKLLAHPRIDPNWQGGRKQDTALHRAAAQGGGTNPPLRRQLVDMLLSHRLTDPCLLNRDGETCLMCASEPPTALRYFYKNISFSDLDSLVSSDEQHEVGAATLPPKADGILVSSSSLVLYASSTLKAALLPHETSVPPSAAVSEVACLGRLWQQWQTTGAAAAAAILWDGRVDANAVSSVSEESALTIACMRGHAAIVSVLLTSSNSRPYTGAVPNETLASDPAVETHLNISAAAPAGTYPLHAAVDDGKIVDKGVQGYKLVELVKRAIATERWSSSEMTTSTAPFCQRVFGPRCAKIAQHLHLYQRDMVERQRCIEMLLATGRGNDNRVGQHVCARESTLPISGFSANDSAGKDNMINGDGRIFERAGILDPNLRDRNGETPLYRACRVGAMHLVATLLRDERVDPNIMCGHDPNSLDWMTPLMCAAISARDEFLRLQRSEEGINVSLRREYSSIHTHDDGALRLFALPENAWWCIVLLLVADVRTSVSSYMHHGDEGISEADGSGDEIVVSDNSLRTFDPRVIIVKARTSVHRARRCRFKGVVRFIMVLRRRRLRAAERAYAPPAASGNNSHEVHAASNGSNRSVFSGGGAGFSAAANDFEARVVANGLQSSPQDFRLQPTKFLVPTSKVPFESLNLGPSPCLWVAPMVGQSEPAFRVLCRKYGATLATTPMIDARGYVRSANYRAEFPFFNHKPALTLEENYSQKHTPYDRPLVVQFGGRNQDGPTLVAAAKLVAPYCDAVELNCGCPQRCAREGNFGAYLMEQPNLLVSLVQQLVQGTRGILTGGGDTRPGTQQDPLPECPFDGEPLKVLVKMRVFEDRERTVELARRIEAAGAHLLTVHGRTRHQGGGKRTGRDVADWATIRAVKAALHIPVVANGNVRGCRDAADCLLLTGCDGVMSGCGLLVNPKLFAGLSTLQPRCLSSLRPGEVNLTTMSKEDLDKHIEVSLSRAAPPSLNMQKAVELCLEYLELAEHYGAVHQQVVKHLQSFLGPHGFFKSKSRRHDCYGATSITVEDGKRQACRSAILRYRGKWGDAEKLRHALKALLSRQQDEDS